MNVKLYNNGLDDFYVTPVINLSRVVSTIDYSVHFAVTFGWLSWELVFLFKLSEY